MLTADLSPTFGGATVHGHDIFAERDTVYSMMGAWLAHGRDCPCRCRLRCLTTCRATGYCPQFDALFELLTGTTAAVSRAPARAVPLCTCRHPRNARAPLHFTTPCSPGTSCCTCAGEECLTFYARVKGIPEEDIPAFVDMNLTRMDLQRYRNEITKNYSGGNKRKLSLTVAFVGAPKTVFLGA